jgi:hypothetical protein
VKCGRITGNAKADITSIEIRTNNLGLLLTTSCAEALPVYIIL